MFVMRFASRTAATYWRELIRIRGFEQRKEYVHVEATVQRPYGTDVVGYPISDLSCMEIMEIEQKDARKLLFGPLGRE